MLNGCTPATCFPYLDEFCHLAPTRSPLQRSASAEDRAAPCAHATIRWIRRTRSLGRIMATSDTRGLNSCNRARSAIMMTTGAALERIRPATPSSGIPHQLRRHQFEQANSQLPRYRGQSHKKSASRSTALMCSIRIRTGTLVPENTGVPPRTSGFLLMSSLVMAAPLAPIRFLESRRVPARYTSHCPAFGWSETAANNNAPIRRAVFVKCRTSSARSLRPMTVRSR